MKMFNYKLNTLNSGRILKYSVIHNAASMSYAEALDFWQHNESFRSFFTSILADAPFSAYRWETPPVTLKMVNREFEFVLLDSPSLVRPSDKKTFARYFTAAEPGTGIVVFENLGKDALLVAPSPQGDDFAYAHIAAFTRYGPDSQLHALWQIVGQTIQQNITNQPIWLNTEGHGVSWLHIRLDSRPKYYGYSPYKKLS